MSVDSLMPTLLKLNVAERRQLIARLEETLPENQEPIELSDAQRKLLDERLAEMEANPHAGTPLDEYIARFLKSPRVAFWWFARTPSRMPNRSGST